MMKSKINRRTPAKPQNKRKPFASSAPKAAKGRVRVPLSSFSSYGKKQEKPKRSYNPPPKPARTKKASFTPRNPQTSWGSVAEWYKNHLEGGDTYHNKVILPNLLRLIEPRRGDAIIELASGTGFFASKFAAEGAMVTGIEVSEELVEIARKHSPQVSYHVGNAEKFDIVNDNSKDKVVIVLAIQNIEAPQKVFAEAARVLKPGGAFHLVMNHPAFRIPKHSSWNYDDKRRVQYRRVDQYMSESAEAIDMHPGMTDSPQTLSFHRPLQYYFKALAKAGFAVDRLEEWISHKNSNSGGRAVAENNSRKEIPLFLYLKAIKLK